MDFEYYLAIVEKRETFELGKGPWFDLTEFEDENVCLNFNYQQFYDTVSNPDASDLWKDKRYIEELTRRVIEWKEAYKPMLLSKDSCPPSFFTAATRFFKMRNLKYEFISNT